MSLNFGHRGFSGKYPENTMLSFEKCVEVGADGIELDVHLTKDGQVVIIHDELLDRTTDHKGLVMDHTLAELKEMDASADFVGVYGKNEIPTLDEYLDFVKDKPVITNIELKTGIIPYPGIEQKTLDLIDKYHLRDKIIISSFNHYSVVRMKELAPDMKYGLLEDSRIVEMAAYAKRLGVDYLHPLFYTIDEQYLKEAAENNLGINAWTVNSEEDIRKMIRIGIHGIIGNNPDICAKLLCENKK